MATGTQQRLIPERHIVARKDDGVEPLPPGSKAAIAKGCVCDPFFNNSGLRPPWHLDGWWISLDCKIHRIRRFRRHR